MHAVSTGMDVCKAAAAAVACCVFVYVVLVMQSVHSLVPWSVGCYSTHLPQRFFQMSSHPVALRRGCSVVIPAIDEYIKHFYYISLAAMRYV